MDDNKNKGVSETEEILDLLDASMKKNNEKMGVESGSNDDTQNSHISSQDDVKAEANDEPVIHFTDCVEEKTDISGSHFTLPEETELPPAEAASEDDETQERKMEALKRNRVREKGGGVFSSLFKAIIYIAFIFIVSAFASYYIITVGNDVFAFVKTDKEVTMTVEESMTATDIARSLKKLGVIEYEWAFRMYSIYQEDDDAQLDFLEGEHTFNCNMNYEQILTELTVVPYVRTEIWITVPEGYTVDQIINMLLEQGIGTREGYEFAINNYAYRHEFVRLLEENGYPQTRKYRLEGYLYPDTYAFYKESDEVTVINKMLNNFDDKFWDEYEDTYKPVCDSYGMTFDEIVTLASIVQAEGKTLSDYENISQVFHNRMKSESFTKMESCATIQYILPERHDIITAADLLINSPYNTYMYDGLPPGAVCNPGLDALEAAIYPDMNSAVLSEYGFKKENVFFFNSDLSGKIYYAQTLNGHERNKALADAVNQKILSGEYKDD